MRGLLVLVVAMGVLILVGVTTLGVLIMRRLGDATAAAPTVVLDEPPGSRIAGVAAAADRVVLQVTGGGPDRVVVVDPRSGRTVGRVVLAH